LDLGLAHVHLNDMDAGTLNCPTCGAAIAGDAVNCKYCGARLATVACPSCFGMAFVGSKFCPHCGAELEWPDQGVRVKLGCPRCRDNLEETLVGKTKLHQCARCGGTWIGTKTFTAICAQHEEQTALLGIPVEVARAKGVNIRSYAGCPVCKQLMNRMQYSRGSGVIVDTCKRHGVWLDRDELSKIIEFIRAGGLDRARQKEIEDLQRERLRQEGLHLPDTHHEL
jgi:Zn-finger nucleic acid-binding protein